MTEANDAETPKDQGSASSHCSLVSRERFDELYLEKLGMCGCGRPEEVAAFIHEILDSQCEPSRTEYADGSWEAKKERQSKAIKETDSGVILEFVLHALEHSGMIEHGSSVFGSWPTAEGNEFLELLKKFKDEI